MNVKGLLSTRAHFGAPLALLRGVANKLPPLRPVAKAANQLLARYTDARAKAFDAEHGTDTFGRVGMRELGLEEDGSNYEGWMYGPICQDFFDEMAEAIPARHTLTFLDVGMGKGLAVMRAREFGFRKLVGAELSQSLCDTAAKNFEAYAKSTGSPLEASIVCGDFMKTELADEPTAFFLNNPFPAAIAGLAVEHIEASLAKHPRPAVIVWRRMANATRQRLHQSQWFSLRTETPYWHLWATRGSPQLWG